MKRNFWFWWCSSKLPNKIFPSPILCPPWISREKIPLGVFPFFLPHFLSPFSPSDLFRSYTTSFSDFFQVQRFGNYSGSLDVNFTPNMTDHCAVKTSVNGMSFLFLCPIKGLFRQVFVWFFFSWPIYNSCSISWVFPFRVFVKSWFS